MSKLPFKFEHWHLGSDTLYPYSILDWSYHYNLKTFEFKQRNFTGKFYNLFSFRLAVARHEFGFRLEWGFGTTTPELAYREYHDRIKQPRTKQEQK